ncbi:MAG: carbamoyl-phosphate synthase small subunit [Candidatus Dadabacteria bacterium]|nr:MAG: carbamoyl-phosphate synthase small subunit [Candidatus Dadabacteria bacterium]
MREAYLALADGTVYSGMAFGSELSLDTPPVWGEVVFNTSMFGYQEILTDPSYAGQIMCFTNPHIGNVGCNKDDVESRKVWVRGVIVSKLSREFSNYRGEESLDAYLKREGIIGIEGLDTREIVRKLREGGAQVGIIGEKGIHSPDDLVDMARTFDYSAYNFVEEVSCSEPYVWTESVWDHDAGAYRKITLEKLSSRPHVVAIDCGIKRNILRLLLDVGFRVTVIPYNFSPDEIAEISPDCIFLSNGPGDPSLLGETITTVQALLGRYPIFGICLGHQILSQALGGKTYKLKFGHRGGNHPVRDEATAKVEITVQNHGFAVSKEGLPNEVFISHINLNDMTVEGVDVTGDLRAFSVQYHPEASPGPHDAAYLFKRFYSLVTGERYASKR